MEKLYYFYFGILGERKNCVILRADRDNLLEGIRYNSEPKMVLQFKDGQLLSFLPKTAINIDPKTVDAFGEEWSKFNGFSDSEIKEIGDQYFDVAKKLLLPTSVVLDAGCGSGRWTKYVANKVKFVEAIDPSNAVFVAYKMVKNLTNVRVTQSDIDNIPFANESFDLVFCLGVLHHIPDTEKALNTLVGKLKKGGNLLVYLYYNLDNRGLGYKTCFFFADLLRKMVSALPFKIKAVVCDILALTLYLPLVYLSIFLKKLYPNKSWFRMVPLSYYRDKSWYVIRNDSLDRFGTPLEKRYSRLQIQEMMERAGLKDVLFSPNEPYWHCVGTKK